MGPIQRASSFEQIESGWLNLLPHCSTNAIFLNPLWQKTWYRELGGNGELLLLYDKKDGVQAVAPLLKCGKTITFIGSPDVYDYADFIVSPEKAGEFFKALISFLGKEDWTDMKLFSIPEGSPTLDCLPAAAKEHGYSVKVGQEDVCPGVQLASTWDEYLAGLTKKDRHELRRKLRRLYNQHDVQFRCLTRPDDVMGTLDTFLELMRESRDDKRDFLTPERERFFRSIAQVMAQHDFAKLFSLDIRGVRTSVIMCFDYNGQRGLYNSGFRREYSLYSVGLLVKALALQDAIQTGKNYFDFLRGNEPYKYDLGGKDRKLYSLTVTRT